MLETLTRQSAVDRLARFRSPLPVRAALLLALDLALFTGTWLAILAVPNVIAKCALGIINGLVIGRLFILAHDACHGSGYTKRWANQLAGRIGFLPSLTPFSTWELGHNTLHHGFTNLRGKDYVYAPLTKDEYDELPRWRRVLEHAYRHPLGPGLAYAVEIWWKRLWFPRDTRPRFFADSLLTAIYLAMQIAIALAVAARTGQSQIVILATAIILPQIVWNCLMGFATFQHHTHPEAVWYNDRKQWDPLTAQIDNSVHVEFPPLVSKLLHNIMDHTAHHLDVRIPLFHLPAAQRELEKDFDTVPVQRWSWSAYADNCRRCQLYDFDRQRWLYFDGTPST